jgi:hypothetical protein
MHLKMSCYDFFNFEKDFKFQNHKGDIVIIPKGEYQTKSLDNMLNGLIINSNNEIEKPIWKTEVFVEYPKNDPRRWKTEKIGYQKIDFFGVVNIYHYDFDDKNNDKIFDLYVDDGKIFKIEEKLK